MNSILSVSLSIALAISMVAGNAHASRAPQTLATANDTHFIQNTERKVQPPSIDLADLLKEPPQSGALAIEQPQREAAWYNTACSVIVWIGSAGTGTGFNYRFCGV